jgi:ubiquinone/menaquinone biosynthesis C-methylase UbiE
MLNFGYWTQIVTSAIEVQIELCKLVREFANLQSAKKVLDIGSGFCAPAILWKSMCNNLDIVCIDVNFKQLATALEIPITTATIAKSDLLYVVNKNVERTRSISVVNAAATRMPFATDSIDTIIALESAQHFKPLTAFLGECRRVLTSNGLPFQF